MTVPLKFTLAQINPTIGDIDGNIALMAEAARQARAAGSALVIFPELSLTAYYPADLLDEDEFVQRVFAGVERLKQESARVPGIHWVVGAPTANTGIGNADRLLVVYYIITGGDGAAAGKFIGITHQVAQYKTQGILVGLD